MFKKKNKIENSNQSIIDTENLIIGSTFSGKMPMIINGLDLYIDQEAYKDASKFEIQRNGDGSINMIIKHVINYIEK